MAKKKATYREVQYVVGNTLTQRGARVEFYPIVVIDGQEHAARAGSADESFVWSAKADDYFEMSMAYGAALAACDQANARLQEKGLNRLREVS